MLVVEDHQRLAEAIANGLRLEGMAVDLALDGAAALAHTIVTDYDVVVLDRDLPGVHGDQVCRTLCKRPQQHPSPDADGRSYDPRPGRRA